MSSDHPLDRTAPPGDVARSGGPKYEPSNHLCVDVSQAGHDLIELVGIISGHRYCNQTPPKYLFDNMEEAARKALRSIASYRDATAKNIERLSREEYEGLSA